MQKKGIFVDFVYNIYHKGTICQVMDRGLMLQNIIISLSGDIFKKHDVSVSLYHMAMPEWASLRLMQLYGQSICGS